MSSSTNTLAPPAERGPQIENEGNERKPAHRLVLAAIALFSAIPFVPNHLPYLAFALAALLLVSALWRCRPAFHFTLIGTTLAFVMQVPALRVLSLPMILSVAFYAVVVLAIPTLRRSTPWFRRGLWRRETAWHVVAIALVSGTALLVWHAYAAPDLASIRQMLATTPMAALVAIAVLLPMVNALVEELVFRGVMMNALSHAFASALAINLVQAVSFGLLHKDGFPSGAWGILLSGIYAFMLGLLRQRTRGLLAPWIAHVIADIVIFCIIVNLA